MAMTAAEKTALAADYAGDALYGAVYTTAPTDSAAGTEPTGGTPAYARKALTWVPGAAGVTVASATFDIPAATDIVGTGLHSALTAGTYIHGKTETLVNFPTQDTVVVTFTYSQS